jgi:single-strand DNA-binding protein
MRYTPSGVAVTNVNLATSEKISKTRNGEDVPCPEGWKEGYNGKTWELTTWFRATFWRGAGETVNKHLSKGDQIYIESATLKGVADNGTQNPRVWTGNDGTPRASFEITVHEFQFISGSNGGGQPRDEDEPPGYNPAESDIPF